tara:strand:- start:69 stop:515 length:447 start_codon:yes stop_codon:yes gene_type:complete
MKFTKQQLKQIIKEELENLEEWTYGDKQKYQGSADEFGTKGIKDFRQQAGRSALHRQSFSQGSDSYSGREGLPLLGPLARFIRGDVLGIDDSMNDVFRTFHELTKNMASQSKWSGRNLKQEEIAMTLMDFIDKTFYPDSQAVVGDKEQ